MAKKTTTKITSPAPTLTRVSQSAIAKEWAARILRTAMEVALPKALTEAQRRALIAGSNVSDKFIELAAQAYEALGATSGAQGFDPNVVRTAIAFRKSQGPVFNAANALVRAVQEQMLAHFGGAGVASQDLYAQLKRKAKKPNADPAIIEHRDALAEEMTNYRRASIANNKAMKEPNAANRTERNAIKAATKEAKKSAKAPAKGTKN